MYKNATEMKKNSFRKTIIGSFFIRIFRVHVFNSQYAQGFLKSPQYLCSIRIHRATVCAAISSLGFLSLLNHRVIRCYKSYPNTFIYSNSLTHDWKYM